MPPMPKPRRYVTRQLILRPAYVACICGRPVPAETGKAGRPKTYCGHNMVLTAASQKRQAEAEALPPGAQREAAIKALVLDETDACREFLAALNVLERFSATVFAEATPHGVLELRGRLFAVANQRAWNKGVRLPPLPLDKE